MKKKVVSGSLEAISQIWLYVLVSGTLEAVNHAWLCTWCFLMFNGKSRISILLIHGFSYHSMWSHAAIVFLNTFRVTKEHSSRNLEIKYSFTIVGVFVRYKSVLCSIPIYVLDFHFISNLKVTLLKSVFLSIPCSTHSMLAHVLERMVHDLLGASED